MNILATFHDDLVKRYGKALQRLSFDLGLSCPNRERPGGGPCAFCGAKGARARHLSPDMTLEKQAERGKKYLHDRYGFDGPYIAYFQAFTSTYAPLEKLKRLYEKVFTLADFRMAVISTRPDCLPDDVLDYIASLKDRYDVLLEIGVQSAKDETLRKMGRGHDFACVEDAVRRAAARKIPCAAHVILGLPGETLADFRFTAEKLSSLPFCAVKVHNLLILKGTPVAEMYRRGEAAALNEFEYADALKSFLKLLPDNWIVMRLSAEDDPEKVIAPKWWMSKGEFLENFRRYFSENSEKSSLAFHAVKTGDGSYTFYHPAYRQYFHSVAGAFSESWKKYLCPCRIPERLACGENLSVLELGFGLGCNVTALVRCVREDKEKKGSIHVTSLELDPETAKNASLLPEHPGKEIVEALGKGGIFREENFQAELLFMDARMFFREEKKEKFDVIFLDGFSPDTNPELWTLDLVRAMKNVLRPGGAILSYCRAYPFLSALLQNGFSVMETPPFGRRRGGTLALLPPLPSPDLLRAAGNIPLTEKDRNIALCSASGIPYSDPELNSSREEILKRRKETVLEKRREGMPKWFREKKRSTDRQSEN